jgi:hypothetical protein
MAGFCGKCGAPRVDGARFCTGCGADLSTMPVPCPTCGQPWVPPVAEVSAPLSDVAPAPLIDSRPTPQSTVVSEPPPPEYPPAPPGLPRGPTLGEDYIPGQDCGNCGEPLRLQDGTCSLCGSRNTGPTFNPALMS